MSYPNLLPLAAASVEKIVERLGDTPFGALYGAFKGQNVPKMPGRSFWTQRRNTSPVLRRRRTAERRAAARIYSTPSPPSEHHTRLAGGAGIRGKGNVQRRNLYRLPGTPQRRIGAELTHLSSGWSPLDCSTVQ